MMNLALLAAVPATAETAFQRFLRNLAEAKLYQNWRKSNPGEASRWDACVAGGPIPTMVTPFGRALVAVVEMERQP